MHLSLLADQLGSGAGGGRFTTNFIRTLLSSQDFIKEFEQIFLLLTQSEKTELLENIPLNATIIRRRFPSRLRGSSLASILGKTCPQADVAHGLFYYIFPNQAKYSLVTVHDVSVLYPEYHPAYSRNAWQKLINSVLSRCDIIACSSDATASEVLRKWPSLYNRVQRIYCGTTSIPYRTSKLNNNNIVAAQPYLLAVGTIEPRKNYDLLLTAYERLLENLGKATPKLVVIGGEGWLCESTVRHLCQLVGTGKAIWIKSATDAELAAWYSRSNVFTYLSVYEGFGYPPFEAAHARVPMVLSILSSVGEIWSGYARCVDPKNVDEIVASWQWALGLSGDELATVVDRQQQRAEEFSWQRCVSEYLRQYKALAFGKNV